MPGILFVSGWYPSNENPSYGIFVRRHALAAAINNRVSVLYVHTVLSDSNNVVQVKTGEYNNLFEVKISINKKRLVLGAVQKAYYFAWALIAGYYIIKKHSGKPDLVHANILYEGGRQALLLRLFFGLPFVCSEHWTGYHPQDGSYKGFLKKMISGRVARKAKFVLPVTQNLAEAMQSHGLQGNYRVLPNTVDTSIFNTTGNNKKEVQFIHVSSLDERQKNFSGIVKVFRSISGKNPEIKLIVVGGKDNIKAAEEIVERSGIAKEKIIFAGNKNEVEVARLLSQSIALILFSNYENQPCVIIEALACGIPVIATHTGGIGEIVENSNGILVKRGDERALEDAMRAILEKRNTFVPGHLAEKINEQYSYQSVNKQLNEIYNSALS